MADTGLSLRALTARLSVMFFLEIAVVAAYLPLLSLYMGQSLGFSPSQISYVFCAGPVAALIAPPIAGFLADHVAPAERSLSLVSLLRALSLLLAARASHFPEFLLSMTAVGLCSSPSFVLTNAIAFHHLPERASFGKTRVWGTLSWILMLWLVSAYLGQFKGLTAQLSHLRVVFRIAAGFSLAQSAYAWTLPHTPATRVSGRWRALRGGLALLCNRDLRVLLLVAALVSVMSQFYLILQALFYTDARRGLGLDVSVANRAASICQLFELCLFPFLGILIHRFGLRRVLLVAVAAWPLRFFAYAWGHPAWFVVSVQLLHGVNVVLGYAGVQIAVDALAPRQERASAQALLTVCSSGFGSLLGQLGCGRVLARATLADGSHDWRAIYSVPLLIGLLTTLILWLGLGTAKRELGG